MWGGMLGFDAVNQNPLAVLSSPSYLPTQSTPHQLISISQTNIRVDSCLFAKGVVTLWHWVANLHMESITDAIWSNNYAHSHTNSQCLVLIFGAEWLSNSYNQFEPLTIKAIYFVQLNKSSEAKTISGSLNTVGVVLVKQGYNKQCRYLQFRTLLSLLNE